MLIGSAVSYVLGVGSASGLANLVRSTLAGVLGVSGAVPPGAYSARVRGVSGCGQPGPASNEVLVTVQ